MLRVGHSVGPFREENPSTLLLSMRVFTQAGWRQNVDARVKINLTHNGERQKNCPVCFWPRIKILTPCHLCGEPPLKKKKKKNAKGQIYRRCWDPGNRSPTRQTANRETHQQNVPRQPPRRPDDILITGRKLRRRHLGFTVVCVFPPNLQTLFICG